MTDNLDPIVWIYTTVPSQDHADTIADHLIGNRLAACVNMLPGMIAVYEWNGVIERGQEIACFFKTAKHRAVEAIDAIKAQHPYETPAILIFEADGASENYAAWIRRQTAN